MLLSYPHCSLFSSLWRSFYHCSLGGGRSSRHRGEKLLLRFLALTPIRGHEGFSVTGSSLTLQPRGSGKTPVPEHCRVAAPGLTSVLLPAAQSSSRLLTGLTAEAGTLPRISRAGTLSLRPPLLPPSPPKSVLCPCPSEPAWPFVPWKGHTLALLWPFVGAVSSSLENFYLTFETQLHCYPSTDTPCS